MSNHAFNFDGGEILSKLGASWFVAYAYFCYADKSVRHWANVSTYQSRISTLNRSKQYHIFWLKHILHMNNRNLNRNTIGLPAEQVKKMANDVLQVLENNQS